MQRSPAATIAPTQDHNDQQMTNIDSILQLQHAVGNQAVMRMLATNTHRPMLQRAPEDFGLKTKTNTSSFVTEAVGFWKKTENKDKTLDTYATFLLDKVNDMLTAKCVSQFITSGGDSGSFSRVTWNIKINTSKFSTNTTTDTVGELTADEAAEVADTIYHEARHSQQYYTAAQIMAGEGSDAAAIAVGVGIPQNIADLAFANPIKADKKNKAMIAAVKDWQKIGSGAHSTYKGLVNNFMDPTEDARKLAKKVTTANLATTKSSLDTTVTGWKSTELVSFKAEVDRIEKMTDKSKGDKLVLSHAKKIVKLLEAVITLWEKTKDHTAASILKWAGKAQVLEGAVYKAYRDHLHEKDAWAVGGAAGAGFRKLAKKKTK